jgi:hypothetical protein
MNSWVLLDLGSHAEQVFGTSRYLVIYLISSVFGFVASLFWSPMIPSIGASAAACGLIGAMMAYGYRSGSGMIWSFYLRWILLIAVIGLLPGFNIDNAAHFGGFVAGFVVAYLAGTQGSRRRGRGGRRVVRAGLSIALARADVLVLIQAAAAALGCNSRAVARTLNIEPPTGDLSNDPEENANRGEEGRCGASS